MPTKNAAFYSCKAGRPDTLRSHRLREAAVKAAGEYGQIWDGALLRQRQVHQTTDGKVGTFTPDGCALNLKALLVEKTLIADVGEYSAQAARKENHTKRGA
jgi:hypothetical protein